jgi:hypothetical protein
VIIILATTRLEHEITRKKKFFNLKIYNYLKGGKLVCELLLSFGREKRREEEALSCKWVGREAHARHNFAGVLCHYG